jgi:hypothetical protein
VGGITMKRAVLFLALLLMGGVVFAEEPFKIIIIPIVDNFVLTSPEKSVLPPMDESLVEINKIISEKIAQTICLPKYKKTEMMNYSNEQYINSLPEKGFLIKGVNDSRADGILVFEINRIDFVRYTAKPVVALSCLISCHIKTFNVKTGIYIDEKFNYASEPYKYFTGNRDQLNEILTNSVKEAINKIFSRLPQ